LNKNKKILIATTFRNFNGSENDKIQRMFLNSLVNQSYKNFKLIITVFKEKNVQTEISKYPIDAVFYKHNTPEEYKFSMSVLTENLIKEINLCINSIGMWTTCDVIFDSNFFSEISKNSSDNFFGTSHPHITYKNLNDFNEKISIKNRIESGGMDCFFFDSKILLKNEKILKKYPNKDWGLYENFLTGIAIINKCKMINIFNLSKILKIDNDRKPGKETIKWLRNSYYKNNIYFEQFVSDYNLNTKIYYGWYMNLKFKVLGNKIKYFLKYSWYSYIRRYPKSYIKNLFFRSKDKNPPS
tara:strand:- start:93 stop:986 length:894 start_codon:yes stop_codon:yes gene_type:complete